MLERLAAACYERRRLVLFLWIVALMAMVVASQRVGGDYDIEFRLPASDSQEAFDILEEHFGSLAGDPGRVVFRADDVRAPEVQGPISALLDQLRTFTHVDEVTDPFQSGQPSISIDGTVGFAQVLFDEPGPELPREAAVAVAEHIEGFEAEGVEVAFGGSPARFAQEQGPGDREWIGLVAAVFILLVTFGSVIAMGLPIITAIFGIGIGISLIAVFARFLEIPDFAPTLGAMIGLGVGIDYALFIVTRYRQTLHAGADPKRSVIVAIITSGRAVLFAGVTVVISLMGMLLIGLGFIRGLAIGAATTVLVTMVASVTLLPAILGFAGRAIDRLHVPFLSRDESDHRTSFWFRWSRVVQRRPVPAALIGTLILVVVALPLFSIRLGFSDESNDPPESGTRRAYDMLADGFGAGYNGPLVLAASLNEGSDIDELKRTARQLSFVDGIAFAAPITVSESGDAAIIPVIPETSPQDVETRELIERLRDGGLEEVFGADGPTFHVGSITAAFVDMSDFLQSRLPVFIGAVVALSFLLLMVVFRSIVIPLKAAIVNLLGIGAAYGVVVAIFQWGWLKDVVGIERTGPVEPFLPMMLFAILFGLSMDYEVFLMSRIREEYLRHRKNDIAVADGLAATARVITAAAAIMVTLFLSFVLGDDRVVKLFGMGLAVAIFLDATLIRMVIVPSFMELFGDTNWWLPKWIDRLIPKISIEAAPDAVEAPPAGRPKARSTAKTTRKASKAKATRKPTASTAKTTSGAKRKPAKRKPAKGKPPARKR